MFDACALCLAAILPGLEPALVRAAQVRLDTARLPKVVEFSDCCLAGGPFAFQANDDPRRYDPLAPAPGLSVLEVGGGLSGFQFVLSRCGCRVTNVGPAYETVVHWPLDRRTLSLLNRCFGTAVMLKQGFLQDAGLSADAFGCAVSISVVEDIRQEDIVVVLGQFRALRELRRARSV